ncbi:MAG: phytanoyl-CoA dioxygenase family protein [Acidimicrobiales bacterium]
MEPEQLISDDVIERFSTDGVVYLQGALSGHWIDLLRRGIEKNLASPSERGRLWNRDEHGRTTFYDSQVWRRIPEYRRFVLESPMAEIACRLLGSSRVNFFFDAIFVRSAGTKFRTPFHQDEPYWSVEGFDTCSAWTPLVPVAKESALEFVRGSHRWGARYRQANFGALTGDERDQVAFDDGFEPFPDVEGRRHEFDLLSWEMEPGDVAVFNARMIHGGSGSLADDRELRVFNTQWLGDDVRVAFRDQGMDPDHTAVMTGAGLGPGDRVGTDLYPEVWSRSPIDR